MESTSVSRKFFFYIMAMVVLLASCSRTRPRVLVFTKTEAYRHESIEAGIAAFRTLAEDKRFEVTFTEEPDYFVEDSLSQYRAVVFLNTTGDVLNDAGQEAFERFIQAGGGYLGIHSAADTEYDWPWYGGLTGGYFLDHPDTPGNVQSGTFAVANPGHWSTEGMPDTFDREDEFYNFRNLSSNIQVVLTLDETTYQGGKHGDDHPMSWYQGYDGGRSFYTAMGHTIESYSEPMFLGHVWAGLRYVMGGDDPQPLDYSRSRPEENRFTKVILAENLDEPMELIALDEKRILFIQRKGEVRLFDAETGQIKTIARIPVSTLYDRDENGDQRTAEDGLMGLTRDPNYAENQWIYLYYSTTKDTANVLSRFEMSGDELLLESEKQILKVPVQRKQCCHTGGSMAWDVACYQGQDYTGFAPMAGAFWDPLPKTCPAGPVTLRHIHGTGDSVVPMTGRPIGSEWHQGDVIKSFAIWKAVDGCLAEPTAETQEGDLSCQTWNGCDSGRSLELCLHPGGHLGPAEWVGEGIEWVEAVTLEEALGD